MKTHDNSMDGHAFVTYGLTDPRTGAVFYVGYTSNLRQRLGIHRAGDAALPSYRTCMEIKAAGLRVGHCIFGFFDDKLDARKLERVLVLTLPSLTNSRAPQGLLSNVLHPMTLPAFEPCKRQDGVGRVVAIDVVDRPIWERGRGRPHIHADRKAYKAAKERERRAKSKTRK